MRLTMKLPIIKIKIAEKGTLWWSNTKRRTRDDMLITLSRHYLRPYKLYIYRLTIFRFTIGVMFP